MKNKSKSLLFIGNLLLIFQLGCSSPIATKNLEVKELFWERAVYIEEYTTVTEDSWADQLPAGAKKISSAIVPKGTNVILSREDYTETEKYSCGSSLPLPTKPPQPTKYCERTVTRTRNNWGTLPEDRERITYEIKRWQEADKTRAQLSSGDDTQPPVWAEPQVDNKTTRTGRRTEFYSVTLATTAGEPKVYKRPFSFEDWQNYKRGQQVKATFADPLRGEPLTTEIIK